MESQIYIIHERSRLNFKIGSTCNFTNRVGENLKYLENLVKNKEMNFIVKIGNHMSKYGLETTFKNKFTILVHSHYVMV